LKLCAGAELAIPASPARHRRQGQNAAIGVETIGETPIGLPLDDRMAQ
jgi:hypothetical protein